MNEHAMNENEFSRPIPVASFAKGERTVHLEATREECIALARRFGLLELRHLKATVRLNLEPKRTAVRMRGDLDAVLTQACVITLDPIDTHIETSFERTYDTATDNGDKSKIPELEETISLQSEDPPEPIINDTIDVGASLTEQLSLELDPFPKSTAAVFAGYSHGWEENEGDEGQAGPFAALEKLMGKKK